VAFGRKSSTKNDRHGRSVGLKKTFHNKIFFSDKKFNQFFFGKKQLRDDVVYWYLIQ